MYFDLLKKLRGQAVQLDLGAPAQPVTGVLWDVFKFNVTDNGVALLVSWEAANPTMGEGKIVRANDYVFKWVPVGGIKAVKSDAFVRLIPEDRRRMDFKPEPFYNDGKPNWHALNNAISKALYEKLLALGIPVEFDGIYVNAAGATITRGEAEAEIAALKAQAAAQAAAAPPAPVRVAQPPIAGAVTPPASSVPLQAPVATPMLVPAGPPPA